MVTADVGLSPKMSYLSAAVTVLWMTEQTRVLVEIFVLCLKVVDRGWEGLLFFFPFIKAPI